MADNPNAPNAPNAHDASDRPPAKPRLTLLRVAAWLGGVGAVLGAIAGIIFTATEIQKGVSGLLPAPPAQANRTLAADPATLRVAGFVAGQHLRDCAECPEMIVVPGGSFIMGSPPNEIGRKSAEEPQHLVNITMFAAGIFEVTFDAWDVCVREKGCGGYLPDDGGFGRASNPVINVSWNDAKSFIMWLSRRTGNDYRLLTEAEWEYVARAGTTTAYWWGDVADHSYANYGAETCCRGAVQGADKWMNSAPAGSLPANKWGLSEISGNAREWVEDCWLETYANAPADGSAQLAGPCEFRVSRSGGWYDFPTRVRSAERWREEPTHRMDVRGFRVARSLAAVAAN